MTTVRICIGHCYSCFYEFKLSGRYGLDPRCTNMVLRYPDNGRRLHLEARKMIKSDTSLSSTIDTVHDVMRSCKQKLRNRTLLRNLSTFSPVLNNETRRSSTYHMIVLFNDIREALIEVADSDDSESVIGRRVSFKNKNCQIC